MRYFILILLAFLASCASAPTGTPREDPVEPEWILLGPYSYTEDNTRIFVGVGSVEGIKMPALRCQTAQNRARKEISRALNTYVTALMKCYHCDPSDYEGEAGQKRVAEAAVVQAYAKRMIAQAKVTHFEEWRGVLYARVVLRLEPSQEMPEILKSPPQEENATYRAPAPQTQPLCGLPETD